MEAHLKPYVHYSDLYDRFTVEKCRRTEKYFKEADSPKAKKIGKEQANRMQGLVMELCLHYETGERYLGKAKTIEEWMARDRKRDELYESAVAPEHIRCLTCHYPLKPTSKDLWLGFDKQPERVLFMYDCPNGCRPSRAFFSDGEEWRTKPHLCPRCNSELNQKTKDTTEKLITTSTCPKCKYVNVDEFVWTHKKEEELDLEFAKDRDRFCLSNEDGEKFRQEKYQQEQLGKLLEDFKKEDDARKEKLKENPKGFPLDGVGYTCHICHASTPLDGNWYDALGIKCLICQRALDRKEIPASVANEDSWYSKYDLEHSFNLKAPDIRAWVKEGLLKARTINKPDGSVHIQLFLLKDNRDFLPPKKMVESRSVKETRDGKDWYTTRPWYHFVDPFKYLKDYKIMEHMRLIPPEEMKAREEEEKKKREEKQARREARRAHRLKHKPRVSKK